MKAVEPLRGRVGHQIQVSVFDDLGMRLNNNQLHLNFTRYTF